MNYSSEQLNLNKPKRKPKQRKWASQGNLDKVGSGIKIASQALTVARSLQALINVETKVFDHVQSQAVPQATSGGYTDCITEMGQGATNITRNGNSIKLTRVQLRAKITLHASATATVVRFIAIRQNDCHGDYLGLTDILSNTNIDYAMLCPFTEIEKRRFSVLHDSVHIINATNPVATIAIDNSDSNHVRYIGTSAAVASAGPGQIIYFAVSNEGTNTPQLNVCSRISFVDN